ncbi:MAG: hypothetical protein K6C12_01010 [Oscillospiraceae bacterium]|nr:hypothetical protein [Oscillospiraceae bacterium]
MTNKEYLLNAEHFSVDKIKINSVKKVYSGNFPDILEKIISNCDRSVFLENGVRVLSYSEVMDAEKDLHVGFSEKKMIPIADCGENDFIIYDYNHQTWAKFNIIDETVFKKRSNIAELFLTGL